MNIERLFNKEVMSLETYIMFRLKEQTAKLKDELIAKNRAPISLSMGAPTANPPAALLNRLKEILDEDGIHMYSTHTGEPYLRKAIAQRMKNRFGVDLDPETEIFSLVGSKEGIANLVRFITTPKHEEFEKDVIMVPDPCYASYLQFIQCSGAKAYPIAPSLGYGSIDENVGALKNTGIEMVLNGTIINQNGWVWKLGMNLTHYKNKFSIFLKNMTICLYQMQHIAICISQKKKNHSVYLN